MLCKTEHDGENDDLQKVPEEAGQSPKGYDSDNSDHIKELFERMITKEDDNKNHLLPIENERLPIGLTPS